MRETGIFGWYGYYNDFLRRIEKIKETGFDGVMLWWEDEIGDAPISRFEMFRRCEEAALKVFNIHMAGENDDALWSTDKETRMRHLKPIYQTIEEISDLGCFNLVFHLCGKGELPEPSIHLLHSIETLLPYAEANRVILSAENTWRADYLTYVWEAFPGVKELGFCFDTSHANMGAEKQFSLLEQHKEKLSALHISDNDGMKNSHSLPFDGTIPFEKKVLPYLTETKVPFTLEVIADKKRYPEEDTFLKAAYESICELIRKTEEIKEEQEETRKTMEKEANHKGFLPLFFDEP